MTDECQQSPTDDGRPDPSTDSGPEAPASGLERRARRRAESGEPERAADLFGRLAFEHLESGRLNSAVTAFRRALELDPTRVKLFHELAKTHHQLGRFDRAFDTYAVACQLCCSRGQLDKARELVNKMSRLDPNEVLRHAKLAELLAKLDDEERALDQLEKCTDKLLNGRDNLEAFTRVTRRILAFDPQFDALRQRIIELVVTESHAYLRYNLHSQAKSLLELARNTCPDNPSVREALADFYRENGQPTKAAEEFLELARLSADDPGRAAGYLNKAGAYIEDDEKLRDIADEIGLSTDVSSDSESDTPDWEDLEETPTDTPSAKVPSGDPSTLFDQPSTATEVDPPALSETADGADPATPNSPNGCEESTAVEEVSADELEAPSTDASPSDGEELSGTMLPSDELAGALLGLLCEAERTDGFTVLRLHTPDAGLLGRVWALDGRLLPVVAIDDTVYRDAQFDGHDSELDELFADTSPDDLASTLAAVREPWSPDRLEPVLTLTARGLCDLLRRGAHSSLVVSPEPLQCPVESPPAFRGSSLIRAAANHLSTRQRDRVEAVYEAFEAEDLDAWLLTAEPGGPDSRIWLPVCTSTARRLSTPEIRQIGTAIGQLRQATHAVPFDPNRPDVVVSALLGQPDSRILVHADTRLVVVGFSRNRLGSVLATVQSTLDSPPPPVGEEAHQKTPEAAVIGRGNASN